MGLLTESTSPNGPISECQGDLPRPPVLCLPEYTLAERVLQVARALRHALPNAVSPMRTAPGLLPLAGELTALDVSVVAVDRFRMRLVRPVAEDEVRVHAAVAVARHQRPPDRRAARLGPPTRR